MFMHLSQMHGGGQCIIIFKSNTYCSPLLAREEITYVSHSCLIILNFTVDCYTRNISGMTQQGWKTKTHRCRYCWIQLETLQGVHSHQKQSKNCQMACTKDIYDLHKKEVFTHHMIFCHLKLSTASLLLIWIKVNLGRKVIMTVS